MKLTTGSSREILLASVLDAISSGGLSPSMAQAGLLWEMVAAIFQIRIARIAWPDLLEFNINGS